MGIKARPLFLNRLESGESRFRDHHAHGSEQGDLPGRDQYPCIALCRYASIGRHQTQSKATNHAPQIKRAVVPCFQSGSSSGAFFAFHLIIFCPICFYYGRVKNKDKQDERECVTILYRIIKQKVLHFVSRLLTYTICMIYYRNKAGSERACRLFLV